MRRPNIAVILIAAAALAGLAAPARAQGEIATVRIYAVPEGGLFSVDGVVYNRPVTVAWPAGTKHILVGISNPNNVFDAQYSFKEWTANSVALAGNPVTVTADPKMVEFKASFEIRYALTIAFFECPECGTPKCAIDPSLPQCHSPGKIYVDGTPVTSDFKGFFGAGSTVTLIASPNDKYVFAGWVPDQNQVISGFINTVTMKGPVAAHPQFVFGRRINLVTDPPELLVLADRTRTATPAALDWGIYTKHTLGPLTPQQDKYGVWWAFQSWSTGAPAIHVYELDNNTQPVTLTAKYVRVAVTQVSSLPPGLPVKVDNRDNWDTFNFPWGVGETHKIEAPAELTDEQGRTWRFRSWSDGGAASHDITVPEDAAGIGVRLVATYDPLARLLIKSSFAGLRVSIDDVECTTPCDIQRDVNSKVRVKAPASIPMGENVRSDFAGWRGTGTKAVEWSGTLGADPVTITADYQLMNRLVASADPQEGASWRLSPASEDGYYDTKTSVTVGVTAQAGYRFRGWSGDLSGTAPTGVLAMSAPRIVRAIFDRVPYVNPAALSNAAGVTPRAVVAPGSVASIFGVNLTNSLVIGPEVPLAQTLGGLTVRLGERFLPLFFVSPSQVNLQLPSDLGEGTQVVTISVTGSPDVRTSFSVTRSAPGIFTQSVNGELFAVAAHEDGTPVTLDSPARKGELLSVYGTGFGPTNRPRPEGFPVPRGEPFLIADPIAVQIGDIAIASTTAFASAGRVGVDVVQFRLGEDVPGGANASVRLSINGQDSNSVLLPIQ